MGKNWLNLITNVSFYDILFIMGSNGIFRLFEIDSIDQS